LESAWEVLSAYEILGKSEMVDWLFHIFGSFDIEWPHNFWTWNPSRSSKVSKDSDCSLVSYKNFSKILILSNGWHPGPGEVGQGGLSTYDVTHKISVPTNQQNVFWMQTRRLAASFDTLSIALTGPEKFPHKVTCVFVFFSRSRQKRPDAKVLSSKVQKILTPVLFDRANNKNVMGNFTGYRQVSCK